MAGEPTPVFHKEMALEFCGDDEEFLNELLTDMVSRGAMMIERADAARQACDWDTLHREAHTMKGSAATVACHPLRDAADFLAKSAKARNSADADSGLQQLHTEFERFRNYVQSELKLRV